MSKKAKTIISICFIAVILIALTFMILDWCLPLNIWTHPILNFLCIAFFGFAIITFYFAFTTRTPWYFFLCAILLGLVAYYIVFQYTNWWIALIVGVVNVIIISILSFIFCGSKTEEISLNKDKDYKDYKERKTEKEAQLKIDDKKDEELPKIKSFKD